MFCNHRFSLIIWINRVLYTLTGILFLTILIIAVEVLFMKGWTILPTVKGIHNAQNCWATFAPLLKAFTALLTLSVAVWNITKYLDISAVNVLGNLRSALATDKNMKIHHWLSSGVHPPLPDGIKEVDIYHYIGTIELGAIMVKRGAIGLKEFHNQFGYRIENILQNREVMGHITRDHRYYEDFNYIVKRLREAHLINE